MFSALTLKLVDYILTAIVSALCRLVISKLAGRFRGIFGEA